MEHLNLALQGQTTRHSRPAESATLLYADVCMLLAEESEEARKWAETSYHEVGLRVIFRCASYPLLVASRACYVSAVTYRCAWPAHRRKGGRGNVRLRRRDYVALLLFHEELQRRGVFRTFWTMTTLRRTFADYVILDASGVIKRA